MTKTAKEIIEQYFKQNPNSQLSFYWGRQSDKITLYKNNMINQIYIDIWHPESSAFYSGINLTIKYPQEVDKIKKRLFTDAQLNYYGEEFDDLNDKFFIEALENHLQIK